MNELRLPPPGPMPPALSHALRGRRRARRVMPVMVAAACVTFIAVVALRRNTQPALIPPAPIRAATEQPTLANLRHADPARLTAGDQVGGGRPLRVSSFRNPEDVAEWYAGR